MYENDKIMERVLIVGRCAHLCEEKNLKVKIREYIMSRKYNMEDKFSLYLKNYFEEKRS
jgi:hypothetical protein